MRGAGQEVVSGRGPDFLFMVTGVQAWIHGRRPRWALGLVLLLLPIRVEQAMAGALERAMLGKAAVVDLSHTVSEATDPPGPEQRRSDAPGEMERAVAPLATHLDTPSAFLKTKPTVAQIPPRDLLVQAVLIDVTAKVAGSPEFRLGLDEVRAWERRNGRVPKRSLVLLCTGWSKRWPDHGQYLNLDPHGVPQVPGFSGAALAFLALERDVWGVGLDTFVPEGNNGEGTEVLLRTGKFRLENLTNLDKLPAKGAKLVIAPLRVDAPSAPARVIAILP